MPLTYIAIYMYIMHYVIFVLHSHHCWASIIGFSEAYNEAVKLHDGWKAENIENWRLKHGDLSDHDVTSKVWSAGRSWAVWSTGRCCVTHVGMDIETCIRKERWFETNTRPLEVLL